MRCDRIQYSVRLFMIMYVLECARSMSWSSRTGPSRDVDAHIPQSRDQGLRRSPSRERQPGRGRVLYMLTADEYFRYERSVTRW